MSGREGRGRPRRDLPTRSEEKSHHGRGNNPPSRHLWVGNISHNLSESALAHHFLQFGKLESVAFQPGRSYAFINYKNDEDAFAAIKMLQGYNVDGNPLRIEFAKAEKALTASRNTDYSQQRWDEPHPMARGSQFASRDSRALESRTRNASPELPYPNKSKMNDKDAEPSEVLWVGFPAQLKVDEFILRKAFSPFGDIEKITAFPGRTYAFVRYRTVMAARRAKETLQGKLFGNPRVHICFARNESGPPSRERSSIHAPPSPRSGSYGRDGSSEHFRTDRDYSDMPGDRRIGSPPFVRNMDPGDLDGLEFSRNANLWRGRNDTREQIRFEGQGSELRLPGNMYDHPNRPPNDIGSNFREYSPREFPRQGPLYDDPWDLPEDASILHGTKKVKTNSFPSENELPEYPFPELGQVKHVLARNISRSGVLDAHFDSKPSGYRTIRGHSVTAAQPFGERDDHWNTSIDKLEAGTVPPSHSDVRRLTPDVRKSSSKEVWKWEGMIVKGGTSVCRARCFPVGKSLDMSLPEYLDCTARTSLDMLAKHYYQAAGVWVVFFVPANDPDIPYYNEFMNYLAERQRAAVAKLDERTTLFLVPPSEFSEKILKVPGKLSISGVILRLDPNSSDYASFHSNERREPDIKSFQSDELYQKPISHSGPYLPTQPSGAMPSTFAGAPHSLSQSIHAQGQDYSGKPALGPNWTSHDIQNTNPNFKNTTSQAYVTSTSSMIGSYSPMPRSMHEAAQSNYTGEISGVPSSGNGKIPIQEKPPVSSSIPVPEQLAQLASSLLGQQAQYGGASSIVEYKPSVNINQSGYSHSSQNYGSTNEQMSSEYLPPQYGQGQPLLLQQQQQPPNFLAASQAQTSTQENQPLQNAGQDDAEADPQKRLQATLQLAAALLQQIQQGKST